MRRNYSSIRKEIFKALRKEPKTITVISRGINADIRTTKKHLLWLEKIEGKVKKIKRGDKIVYKLR